MANLPCLSKSANEWAVNDIKAYNISVHREDSATKFFGVDSLSSSGVDPELFMADDASDMADTNVMLMNSLKTAADGLGPERSLESEESPTRDFVVDLFRILKYPNYSRFTRTRKEFPLFICGQHREGYLVDACLIDRSVNDSDFVFYSVALLVQEDKRESHSKHKTFPDPVPQLIAGAAAAFQFTNHQRQLAGKEPLEFKFMPGIVILGTMPTFYKIPTTAELVRHIESGTFPPDPTIVHEHSPILPSPPLRLSHATKSPDNRK